MTYQNYKKPNLTFFVKTILISKNVCWGAKSTFENSFFFSSNSTHTYAKYSFKHKMAELKQGFLNSLFPFPPLFFLTFKVQKLHLNQMSKIVLV